MKVSVVIPAYNEEKYIRQCLEGLMKQTEPADEIIVVDNNCTDTTIAIAEQFPVRIVREAKQGITFARNRGFDSAIHEIIARCDADTIPPPYWITKIKRHFSSSKTDGVTGPYSFYDLSYNKAIQKLHVVSLYAKMSYAMLGHYPFVGGNMAIRKTSWENVRGAACTDDDRIHEDIDLAIHLAHNASTIVFDKTLAMPTSARRMRSPLPSLIKYIARWPGTKLYHKKN